MTRQSANSLLNSLKGKIWLATSALAFFICTFGLFSYLIVSFLVSDTFYAVFIPFLFLGFTVMVFGWWLSNEVVSPIEKVALMAKSLERGVSMTLPRTSGSSETDELLQTLYRNSQQLQNLVGLMDKVTCGELDVALTPLQNSDRLTNAFQKLLAKVTESINAKQDLEKLQAAVNQLTEEIADVRSGNLDIEIKSNFSATKEIANSVRYLVEKLNEVISQVRSDSNLANTSAVETRDLIRAIIQSDETKIIELNQAKLTLRQIPNNVHKISEELSGASASASLSIEKARTGSYAAQENLAAVSQLRKQIQESVNRTQRLKERSLDIGKVAKTVEDLARRTNMIALNASIQADESGAEGRGFTVIAEEVERLASRAENTNKLISSLDKTISAEISEVEHSLQATIAEAANLSKFAIETGNSLSELERYVGQFLNLQTKLVSFSSEHSEETEKAFQIFIESIGETRKTVNNLKESETGISQLTTSLENLQLLTSDFKLSQISSEHLTNSNKRNSVSL